MLVDSRVIEVIASSGKVRRHFGALDSLFLVGSGDGSCRDGSIVAYETQAYVATLITPSLSFCRVLLLSSSLNKL